MGLAVLGVILIVAGAVLMWALNVDLSFVDDNVLGLILFLAGIAVVILAIIMNMMRGRTKHVEERRYEGQGPQA
jgi:H+/Cl- antiporter ClcA